MKEFLIATSRGRNLTNPWDRTLGIHKDGGGQTMKIICTEDEEEWIKNLMIESDGCALKCHCMLNDRAAVKTACKQCIEENVEFEREEEE